MEIVADKKVRMPIKPEEKKNEEVEKEIWISETKLLRVSDFNYLGFTTISACTSDATVKSNRMKGRRTLIQMRPILRLGTLKIQINEQII